ncbi:39S ribosomal protein L44, mitochondrial [Scheffersomyces spartinae]|uniref:Large ribosomal subunit protein mL53 n=1 Tax=Scheffersomyces spartinae TaxID=45513 RepID=A0A9P7V938_9ASCO|nr:39S ribosomal protein L44, mitochondrial [Scheffersomyces spartinae]KAG7193474.1 39S ribosomal protein L44, mitochondrial [Scheffersomyces spartinae]
MIIKYFSKVSVKFNPFTAGAKPVRLFLSRLPQSQRQACPIDFEVLGPNSQHRPLISVTFKDKTQLTIDPESNNVTEVFEYFNEHSRKLALKDAIAGDA